LNFFDYLRAVMVHIEVVVNYDPKVLGSQTSSMLLTWAKGKRACAPQSVPVILVRKNLYAVVSLKVITKLLS
jgi:hypothetical protein